MNGTNSGYAIFIGAMLAMLVALGVDIATLMNWHEAIHPSFVGTALMHIGSVVGAFLGGKGMPVSRPFDTRQRRSDLPPTLPAPERPTS